jgi:hypothetical protein
VIYSIFIHFLFILCLSSCCPYKIPTSNWILENTEETTENIFYQNQKNCTSHWLYQIIPRHRSQIYWYDLPHWTTWSLMGNDDDGIFGENSTNPLFYIQTPACFAKAARWQARNPFHNFCFYVIGSAERINSEIDLIKISKKEFCLGHYHAVGTTVFADDGSCLYLALHGGKPFISIRLAYSATRRFDFYFGWRCRGNFGIKCLPFAKRLRYDGI